MMKFGKAFLLSHYLISESVPLSSLFKSTLVYGTVFLIFPGITDVKAIVNRVKDYADLIWLENLNLRGQFKRDIMGNIREKHPSCMNFYTVVTYFIKRHIRIFLEQIFELCRQPQSTPKSPKAAGAQRRSCRPRPTVPKGGRIQVIPCAVLIKPISS